MQLVLIVLAGIWSCQILLGQRTVSSQVKKWQFFIFIFIIVLQLVLRKVLLAVSLIFFGIRD